ncbi:MAG: hypothetical protein HC888_10375, partial [Candidatus Competibacteraceae bacterium]|nr:hypothetical protein [Candidatus Competibacteraceae bacterium]
GANVADLLDESLERGEINRTQLEPIVSALLVDKFAYSFRSYNLSGTVEDMGAFCDAVADWGKIEICVSYFHPQAGLFVMNGKRREAFEQALPLLREELIVVFAGPAEPDVEKKLLDQAVADCILLLDGKKVGARRGLLPQHAAGTCRATASRSTAAGSSDGLPGCNRGLSGCRFRPLGQTAHDPALLRRGHQ